MIDEAISFLEKELNSYFKMKLRTIEDKAIASSLVNQDGSLAIKEENKVIITLVDLQEEAVLRNAGVQNSLHNGGFIKSPLPVHLNLFVMFASFFSTNNYQEALKHLSQVILFFQSRRVFDRADYPVLNDTQLEKLTIEMYHPDYQARNNLWSTLGAKYIPSVIYKIKMLKIQDDAVGEALPAVSGLEKEGKSI